MLGAGALGLAGLAARCGGGPAAFDGTLRVLGHRVELVEAVARAARRGLPFGVAFRVAAEGELAREARARPGAFDLVGAYAHEVPELLAAGVVAGLDRTRIERFGEVADLYRFGKRTRGAAACTVGAGDAPFRLLYTEAVGESGAIVGYGAEDGSGPPPGEAEPAAVTGAPASYGLESIGYDEAALGLAPDQVSFAELLNGALRGRVALSAEVDIGLSDGLLAAVAAGALDVADPARPTHEEVDGLVRLVEGLRRRGHVRAFWAGFDESVELMAGAEVVVESLSFPAVTLLRAAGRSARYAAPPEGYRAWATLLCASRRAFASPERLEACHAYVDWWHSGVPGALLMPLGVYNAVQASSLAYVSRDEWDYWIAGEPAAVELDTVFLERAIRPGERRDGGSLRRRSCRIAVWRSSYPAREHARARWLELTAK